jgi:hypothetical protein
MTGLDRAAMDELIAFAVRPAVSVHMPTHRAGREIRQDPIRLKTLLREAGERLEADGVQPRAAEAILKPAQERLDDRAFWRHQDAALAVFLAPHFARWYALARPLRERVAVAQRFSLLPLIPALLEDERFYVLALSRKDVRLVRATRDAAVEVDLGELPRTLDDALLHEQPEPGLQHHVGTAIGAERGGVLHGHETGLDRKESLRQFFHRIDRGVQPLISPREAPLVLAAVDYVLPIYRDITTHPQLLPESITGNPEGLTAADLGARGWELVRPRLDGPRAQAAERYHARAGTGLASEDLAGILPAAQQGRVEELFVAEDAERWGSFDAGSRTVAIREKSGPGAEDLLNLAAIHTLEGRGAVWVMRQASVPGGGVVAAVLRY